MAHLPDQKLKLEERLGAYPQLREQIERAINEVERQGDGQGNWDEAEDALVPLVRKIGQELAQTCAQRMNQQSGLPSGPGVRRLRKKSPLVDNLGCGGGRRTGWANGHADRTAF